MTNREKYKKEMFDVICERGLLAINEHTNEIMTCGDCQCSNCKFHDSDSCSRSFREWLNAEYVEPPKWKFTEDEKAILRNLPEKYKWIARDSSGDLYVYESEPSKEDEFWNALSCCGWTLFDHIFQTIKWADEEPCEFRKYLHKEIEK